MSNDIVCTLSSSTRLVSLVNDECVDIGLISHLDVFDIDSSASVSLDETPEWSDESGATGNDNDSNEHSRAFDSDRCSRRNNSNNDSMNINQFSVAFGVPSAPRASGDPLGGLLVGCCVVGVGVGEPLGRRGLKWRRPSVAQGPMHSLHSHHRTYDVCHACYVCCYVCSACCACPVCCVCVCHLPRSCLSSCQYLFLSLSLSLCSSPFLFPSPSSPFPFPPPSFPFIPSSSLSSPSIPVVEHFVRPRLSVSVWLSQCVTRKSCSSQSCIFRPPCLFLSSSPSQSLSPHFPQFPEHPESGSDTPYGPSPADSDVSVDEDDATNVITISNYYNAVFLAGNMDVGPSGPLVSGSGRAWGVKRRPPGGTKGASPRLTNGPASLVTWSED